MGFAPPSSQLQFTALPLEKPFCMHIPTAFSLYVSHMNEHRSPDPKDIDSLKVSEAPTLGIVKSKVKINFRKVSILFNGYSPSRLPS